MKRVFNLLLLVSFIFLFIYLLHQDLIIPRILNPTFLILSIILLFSGFYASSFSWMIALNTHRHKCSMKSALISHGLSVFAKYIPGKVWVILGRASYLSLNRSDIKKKSFISLKEQLIYLWIGFLISSIPTVIFYKIHWISGLLLLVVTGLTLFLFVGKVHSWFVKIIQWIIHRNLEVPLVSFYDSGKMIGAVTLIWISWTLGFYLFMLAFQASVTPVMMFAFPLSVCIGLLAIFLPGGIVVREGIIVSYLVMAGMEVEAATTISFLNRFWFILGEAFIFLLAILVRWLKKDTASHRV